LEGLLPLAELVAEEFVEGALTSLDDEEGEDEPVVSLESLEEGADSLGDGADSPDFVPSPFGDFLA
jgi:hypothetical protein